MGSMLRNTGAFYMRRSFSTDKMYWDVFREYVRTLITRYHSGVEFFIEGTRSRSFKALTPKIGMAAGNSHFFLLTFKTLRTSECFLTVHSYCKTRSIFDAAGIIYEAQCIRYARSTRRSFI